MNGLDLSDKVAIVTGAGKGIGEGVAYAFGEHGAAVAAVDLDETAAEATAEKIRFRGGRAIAVGADVRRDADDRRAVQAAVDAFGGLDVLVNNAGVVRYGRVDEMSEDDWDLVLDTNLKAQFLMARHAVPEMRRRGRGAIVNTASVQAFASQLSVAAYAASKGGVVSLTRTIALDHAGEGIRANCIAPGSVDTPMLHWAADLFAGPGQPPSRLLEAWAASHPLGRVGTPADVANLVLFLASDLAAFVTGACFVIDGGLMARLGL